MRVAGTFVIVLAATASFAAQAPKPASPPAPPAPTPPAAAAPTPSAPPATEAYTYDPVGRRDPFLNLLGTGAEPTIASKKGEGAAGMAVGDISVRGVMKSQGGLVAMVQG